MKHFAMVVVIEWQVVIDDKFYEMGPVSPNSNSNSSSSSSSSIVVVVVVVAAVVVAA